MPAGLLNRKTRQPQHQTHQVILVPPPVRGLNSVDPLSHMPDSDAVQMDNFISANSGVSVRRGWYEYAEHVGGDKEIGTLMSFEDAPDNATQAPILQSELFAATDDGIYLIEGGGNFTGVAPEIALSGAPHAGRFSFVQFAAGGGNFLVACSELDGGFLYDGVAWIKMTEDTTSSPGPGKVKGIDPSKFVQVVAWKERLMFVQRSSTRAWILPPASVGGDADVFDFGPQFTNGGDLLALVSWTQDAGEGIDDHLVVLGSAGDVAIYKGTDPTDATKFGNAGVWFIGQPPIGRRCFTTIGGNVYILAQPGLIPISQLVQGGLDNILTSSATELVQLRKIQEALRREFNSYINTLGWELVALPGLTAIMIVRPMTATGQWIQYLFQTHTMAWSRLLDIPVTTMYSRLSETYGACIDGCVMRVFDGSKDGMEIDGTGSMEIRARITPAFNYLGSPFALKQALMLRCNFISEMNPAYRVSMNVDLSLGPSPSVPPIIAGAEPLWDTAVWDRAKWFGGLDSYAEWRGVAGMGRSMTPTIYVASQYPTTLASIAYMFRPGGVL